MLFFDQTYDKKQIQSEIGARAQEKPTMKSSEILFGPHVALAEQEYAFALAAQEFVHTAQEFGPGHLLRFVEISDQCSTELIALQGNSDLVAASEAISQGCPMSQDGNTIKVDYASCSGTGEYQLACTAAGGKTIISQLKAAWMVFLTRSRIYHITLFIC